MRIHNLTFGSKDYSCNVYLVQGDWDTVSDVNTLIDVGTDVAIIPRIKARLSGIGKKKIDQVLLTHGDYDHVQILPDIKAVFNPVVYGSNQLMQVDKALENGQSIRIGDKIFKVVHPDIHGSDSLCFLCQEEAVIFTGDAPIHRCHEKGYYSDKFLNVLEMLTHNNIKEIYPGHGPPVLRDASKMIMDSFIKAKKTKKRSI
ncbi:MAG: MBL fold metallo-hydrolase [Proteobacteria bacterium]|nr:MBL fold metallo-hydrolase [Pseudomonadota bacterium]